MLRWQLVTGYLHSKPTGPFRRLKGSQRLWHVFDENTLSLVAYRTEEEANSPNKEPLKSINISQAAFYIDPNEINQFVITVDGKDHVLQSETEEAMYLWLGALQSCRNEALTTGLISAVQEEVSNTTDRKKLPKLQLGKLTTPMLRSTNAPSFDLNEVFSSSPGQIRKDWRLGMGTPQPMPQMGSPLQNRPSTPINGMNRNSPELNRCPVNHDPTAKYRSKSSPCESEAEAESRDSDQLLLRDETEDNVDLYSLNRDTFFGQHAPLLVSTTTPISDKMKFYSLSQRQLYNAPTFSRRGLTPQTFAGSVDMSGFSGSDALETSVTDETGSTPQIVPNFTESFDDKHSPKLYNPTPPPDSTMTTSMCTSNLSTRRASRASDHNTIPLLNSTDETMPYYQHEPYLNKLRTAQTQITTYQEREMHLRELLQQREATIAELEQRLGQLEENDGKPMDLSIPVGASCGQLREILKQLEKRRQHMANRVQFLVSEVRDLSILRQMLTDHGTKQVRYTKKLTSDVIRWKRHFVTLLEACVGGIQLDPAHAFVFCDYGMRKCKAKVGELVEEARRKDPSLPTLSKPKNTDYHVDAFGFKHSYSDDAVVLHFVCRHLRDFYARQLSYEDEAAAQWTEILKQPNRELSRSELKYLCRAGVPPIHRGGIWRMLVHGEMKPIITEKGPHYYNRLISEISESKIATRYRKQISLDLMRTMPNNVLFDGIDAPGIQKLQEILQAYSIHNPDIGYCQGMNFLVAVALIFLNKEDAFWCLTAILEKYLPEKYFNCGLINAQVDQLVLKDLLASKLPKLSEHIRNMEIDISAITLNWFLAVFYDSVPFETLIRIWDVFLLEGSKCLFRFALALLKRNEDMLLLQTDTISFWKCLKSATRMTYDAESLVQTAYEELQPFASRSTISSLQAHHYEILSKELSEKRRLWQNVHKEFDEEAGDDVRVVMKRKKTNVEPSCIQAAMAFDRDSVWICHGGRLCTKMSTVEVQDCRMKHMMLDLDDRVSCMRKLTNDIILFGMMASKICAYSTESKQVLWQLAVHDCVTDLAVVRWDLEDTNKVFAGLSNGELVVIENAGSEHPQDSVYVFPIGFLRVSSILLVDDQIWCASGNGVHIFNTATLDFQGHFVISNNALDLILALKLGKHGVWLAVRGSSLIELWDPKTLTRLLLFNTFSEMYVNRREQDEEGTFNANRVTALLPYEDTIWVGTGSGQILVFEIRGGASSEEGQQDKFNLKETEANTVFLPPKAIDKHETMSPMPRMNRRRTSCYSAISTDLSDKLAQKEYEEKEILPPDNINDRMSVTETKLFTQADEFDSMDAVDLNDEQLKLADSQQLTKHRTEEIQRNTTTSDGEEVLRDSSEFPPSPSSKVTKSRFSSMIETILEDDTSEERLDKVSCAVISDSGRSSPLGETSSTNQRIPSVMTESITPTTKDYAVSGDWQSTTPPNSVQKNIQPDSGVGQLALVLQNSHSHVQNLIQKSESIASSPSTGIHDMHSSTSDDGCPIFPCSTMPFRSLRDDVRVVEQSTDESLRFQLFAIARNKVSETAIRILLSHKNQNDDKCIISCATFFDDDDAVLRWQKWTVEPLIWTNQPIFFYDPSSQIVQLPSYMMNTMTIRKEARRRITVAT